MKRIILSIFTVCCLCVLTDSLQAQGRGRGGDRGGFGGGDRGDRGGPGGRGGGGDRGGSRGPGGGGFRGPGGGGPGGGGPGGGGGRGGRPTMDANGDGRLDKSELEQMPERMREMLKSRGVQIKAGTSVEDFRSRMQEQFTRMREEGGGSSLSGFRDPADGNRSEYSAVSPFRPRTKERVTVDLPPKYTELDTDFDGQIGLYEWIISKRESLDQFDQIDVNVDGMLTPRELLTFDETIESGEARVTKYERERITIVGSSSASTRTDTRPGRPGENDASRSREDDRGGYGGRDRGGFGGRPGGDRGGYGGRAGGPGGDRGGRSGEEGRRGPGR